VNVGDQLPAFRAALGFLSLEPRVPELRRIHRCFDNWRGIGDVVAGATPEEYLEFVTLQT
jgi:hypothetical protein